MKVDNIVVSEIPFKFVTECIIEKNVNQHGTATIIGTIDDAYERKCLELATSEKYLTVTGQDLDVIHGKSGGASSQGEVCLFVGFIDSIEIHCGDSKIVEVKLVTGSKKLDLKERTRSFQNTSKTMQTVLASNQKLTPKCLMKIRENSEEAKKPIENLIVQYKETDWEFAIRMASRANSFIYPGFVNPGSCYYVGLNKNMAAKEKPKSFLNYRITRLNEKYEEYTKGGKLDISPKDAYCYQFDSREVMELCDAVTLDQGQQLYIYSIFSRFDGQELLNQYTLRTEGGFKKPMRYNHKLIGASLEGSILKAERDKVEMALDVDKNYGDHGVRQFAYSTVYSSPDGTGWYCMPEKGDCIRLYFPTEREKDAYAISSVHLEVSGGGQESSGDNPPPRMDPNYKSFKNPAGKEILFGPNRLSIMNPAVGNIILDDQEGIIIESIKSIRFKAQNYVEMHSTTSTLELNSNSDLTLEQGKNVKFALSDDIYMQGGQLRLQE